MHSPFKRTADRRFVQIRKPDAGIELQKDVINNNMNNNNNNNVTIVTLTYSSNNKNNVIVGILKS